MTEETQAAPDEAPVADSAPASGDEPTEDPKPETQDTDQPEQPDEEKEKRRGRRRFQKKIDKLTRQVRDQERELQELRKQPTETQGAPKREDFEDYEDYVEAKAVHAANQKIEAENKRRRDEASEERQKAEVAAMEDAREDLIDRGEDAYPDFGEVCLTDDLQITEIMAEGLIAAEDGQDVWYHLGKNPEKAEKIASLPPARQLYELGALSASLKTAKAPSAAPPPPKPAQGRSRNDNSLSDKDSISDWMAKRRKQVYG